MAYVMRLREGRSSSDLFKCRYVFVTHNNTFARKSREYCLASRMIQDRQWGPVVHLIDLATIAWLRTGLDQPEIIPRGRLISVCERVLQLRPEVTKAVYQKLSEVTPDRLREFELLLHDQRSVRALMDQTAGNEYAVTASNVGQLLEQMRLATIAEASKEFDRRLAEQERKHREQLGTEAAARETERAALTRQIAEHAQSAADAKKVANESDQEAERLKVALERAKADEISRLDDAIRETNSRMGLLRVVLLIVFGTLVAISVINSAFSWVDWLAKSTPVIVITIIVGLISAYCLVAKLMNRPILVVGNALNAIARALLTRRVGARVSRACLDEQLQLIRFNNGTAARH